jgi:hypothetical protein
MFGGGGNAKTLNIYIIYLDKSCPGVIKSFSMRSQVMEKL